MTRQRLPKSLIDWQPARSNGDLRPNQLNANPIVARSVRRCIDEGCNIRLKPDQQGLKALLQNLRSIGSAAKYP